MAQILRPRPTRCSASRFWRLRFFRWRGWALAVGVVRPEYLTGKDRTPTQPVPFSHAHHTTEIGIDCRYCHTAVEVSARAGIPPTATCMTCHSQLRTNAAMLEPVRRSFAAGEGLHWTPVNRLPGYVYVNHSIHVAKGVACATCHGAVRAMRLMRRDAPLRIGWRPDCHRDPGPRLSPLRHVFTPFPAQPQPDAAAIHVLLTGHGVSAQGLTDCSVCHR